MRILSASCCTERDVTVRGNDQRTADMFSYLSREGPVRLDHPLRAIPLMTDTVLKRLSPGFARMYSDIGRPSIPPEQLLRTVLLQALYTITAQSPKPRAQSLLFQRPATSSGPDVSPVSSYGCEAYSDELPG